MNNAVVISLTADGITIMTAVGGLMIALFRRGSNEGRQTEILSNLQSLTTDHEARIRILETHRSMQ